jgi:hypothetical protein
VPPRSLFAYQGKKAAYRSFCGQLVTPGNAGLFPSLPGYLLNNY